MAEEPQARAVHVLVIPYPAQGHILPLLDLAHLLSIRFRLAVTVVVSPDNLPLLSRFPAVSPLVLPFPDIPSPALDNTEDEFADRFAHFQHRLRAAADLQEPLLSWARALLEPPDVVLSDLFHGWTTRFAVDLGVPRIAFSPSSALAVAVSHSIWRRMPQRSNLDDPDELIAFPSLPKSPLYRWRELSTLWKLHRPGDPVCEFVREGMLANTESWGFVLNTFSELEQPYLDYLRDVDLGQPRVWAVGPLIQPGGRVERGGPGSVAPETVEAWLDGCEEDSVVYVAFGSVVLLSPPQAAAIAAGLESSGVPFVWAARDGTAVPEGFEERVSGRGLVIRGWAAQVAILNHPAVGAFLTHCGWNSVTEAAAAGVALLTWPTMADQFVNARLMEEEAAVAVRVCGGRIGAVPEADLLALALAGAVGEAGRGRRETAKAMAARTREATEEGGSSYSDLEKMVEELLKLVVKSKA